MKKTEKKSFQGFESYEEIKRTLTGLKVIRVQKGFFAYFDCRNHTHLRKLDSRAARVIAFAKNGDPTKTTLFVQFARQARGDEQIPSTILEFKMADFRNTSEIRKTLKI